MRILEDIQKCSFNCFLPCRTPWIPIRRMARLMRASTPASCMPASFLTFSYDNDELYENAVDSITVYWVLLH